MKHVRDLYRAFGWALPASVALHLLIVALLIFGLPAMPSKPQEEQVVTVHLAPPPKPPEKTKPEAPPPAKKPAAEKPQAEKPQQAKEQTPSTAAKDAPQPAPLPVMKPVVQFGDKDAGPRQSADGGSAQDGSASQGTEADKDGPERDQKPDAPQSKARPPATSGQGPAPSDATRLRKAIKLKRAKKLFSQAATGDLIATTAMGDVPRGVRGGRLCVTELREQLRHGSPPYYPDLLPSYPLDSGTVIEAPRAAFRVSGQWQNLSYRCEVDANATKVISFALQIGGPVPRSEWKQRKLPSR